MKKDIPLHKFEDLAIAIAPRSELATDGDLWDVYLLNFKEDPIRNVIIHSRGYGELEGESRRTSQFRFFFDEINPLAIVQVEGIQPELFDLTHEFWVSFWYNEYLFDKKYVFVQGSISTINFTAIPFLGRKGVMIR
jgi:hypothetical protein